MYINKLLECLFVVYSCMKVKYVDKKTDIIFFNMASRNKHFIIV